jgi:hypothetical protein
MQGIEIPQPAMRPKLNTWEPYDSDGSPLEVEDQPVDDVDAIDQRQAAICYTP